MIHDITTSPLHYFTTSPTSQNRTLIFRHIDTLFGVTTSPLHYFTTSPTSQNRTLIFRHIDT
ncbi:MAG: hypothetical protein IPN94_19610 [Sphingobacteriales bacterium]|nr:hypothetical protein [Sphingobacteriales bacterium]